MTERTHDGLDADLRALLEGRLGTGRIEAARIDAGRHADYTGTITFGSDRVFCKAVRASETRLARMLVQEAAIGPRLGSLAPAIVDDITQDGWRVLLFEHLPGHHVDLAPSGTGLERLGELIDGLHQVSAGFADLGVPSLAAQWRRASPWRRLWGDPPNNLPAGIATRLESAARSEDERLAVLEGDRLAHTDLHALNLLEHESTIRIVDWAWARTGPAWYDAVMLTLRLVEAGRTPAEALHWLQTTTAGAALSDQVLHGVVLEAAGMWTWLATRDAHRPHLTSLADLALNVADYIDDAL